VAGGAAAGRRPPGRLPGRAGHIRRAIEAELYFYSRVFGFELADPVDPVPIAHLQDG
jgi:hypothetical protein